MERVSIDQARERLTELVQRAAAGEDIVIAGDRGDSVRLQPLDISLRQAKLAGSFDSMHRDPFDRLIAA